jgi:hypothetical protein
LPSCDVAGPKPLPFRYAYSAISWETDIEEAVRVGEKLGFPGIEPFRNNIMNYLDKPLALKKFMDDHHIQMATCSNGGGGNFSGGFRSGGGSFNGGFTGNDFRGGFSGNRGSFRGGFVGNRSRFGSSFFFGYGYPYSYGYYPDYSYWSNPYPYDYGYGYGYDPGYYGYDYGATVSVPPPAQQPPPSYAAPQNYGTAPQQQGSYNQAPDYYLIAFNDHTIQAAVTYSIDGDTLRWTTREGQQLTAPLSSVDRRFSEQINRDRRVEFRLP